VTTARGRALRMRARPRRQAVVSGTLQEAPMPRTTRPRHSTPAHTSAAVDAIMATLDHPHADAVQRLRAAVLGVDPAIAEGVK